MGDVEETEGGRVGGWADDREGRGGRRDGGREGTYLAQCCCLGWYSCQTNVRKGGREGGREGDVPSAVLLPRVVQKLGMSWVVTPR